MYKLKNVPVSNRLQAVETILDRNVQLKNGPNRRELEEALRFVRSLQRTLNGSHYVRERSLKQFNESPQRQADKANWRRVQRKRAIEQNGILLERERSK